MTQPRELNICLSQVNRVAYEFYKVGMRRGRSEKDDRLICTP